MRCHWTRHCHWFYISFGPLLFFIRQTEGSWGEKDVLRNKQKIFSKWWFSKYAHSCVCVCVCTHVSYIVINLFLATEFFLFKIMILKICALLYVCLCVCTRICNVVINLFLAIIVIWNPFKKKITTFFMFTYVLRWIIIHLIWILFIYLLCWW